MVRNIRKSRERYAALGYKLVGKILLQQQSKYIVKLMTTTPMGALFKWMIDAHEVRSETEWRILVASANRNVDIGVVGPKRWRQCTSWSRGATFEDVYLETPIRMEAIEEFPSRWEQRLVDVSRWGPDMESWVAVTLERWDLKGSVLLRRRELRQGVSRRKPAETRFQIMPRCSSMQRA